MNKTELIKAIAERSSMKTADVKTIVDAAVVIATEQLAKEESIQLAGFGTFETRERAATTARNPRTGETVDVPAKRVPTFKAGKALKDAVK